MAGALLPGIWYVKAQRFAAGFRTNVLEAVRGGRTSSRAGDALQRAQARPDHDDDRCVELRCAPICLFTQPISSWPAGVAVPTRKAGAMPSACR